VLLRVLYAGLTVGCNRESRVDVSHEEPAGFQLRKSTAGWELTRNGTPYLVRGAGGDGPKELLARLGANSVRTWGTDDLEQKLDEAHTHGLTVTVGIWLGHERHGFDYNDPAQIARQKEKVKEAVLRYKDHPAVLLWGLGNEMKGYGRGDNDTVWKAVNDLALLVKGLDPMHPTMTVVAEIGGERVPRIHRLCPAIDIVGINSYERAPSVAQRYRDVGGTKRYILTEFGPPGPWEVGKTPWGGRHRTDEHRKGRLLPPCLPEGRRRRERPLPGVVCLHLGSQAGGDRHVVWDASSGRVQASRRR
jgi:hypothetical protein